MSPLWLTVVALVQLCPMVGSQSSASSNDACTTSNPVDQHKVVKCDSVTSLEALVMEHGVVELSISCTSDALSSHVTFLDELILRRFSPNTNLTSLAFSNCPIERVHSHAFRSLSTLKTLQISEQNHNIILDPAAFVDLAQLEKITLSSMRSLPPGLFAGNPLLKSVVLRDSRLGALPPSLFTPLPVGQNVTVRCVAAGAVLRLYTPFERVEASGAATLAWTRVLPDGFEGYFSCQVSDGRRAQSVTQLVTAPAPAYVDAVSSPVTVREGSPLQLTCDVKGVGPATVYWRLPDGSTRLVPTDWSQPLPQLVFSATASASQHQGVFDCTLVSESRNSSRSVVVDVQTKPQVQIAPTATVKVGDTVRLTCTVEANPSPNVTWNTTRGVLKSQRSVDQMHVVTLWVNVTVESLDRVETYVCAASNSVGSAESRTALSFDYTPVVRMPSSTVRVEEGAPLQLTCTVVSYSTASVQWFGPAGDPLMATSTSTSPATNEQQANYSIAAAKYSQQRGLYRCVAQNKVGTAENNVTVEVYSRYTHRCTAANQSAIEFQLYNVDTQTHLLPVLVRNNVSYFEANNRSENDPTFICEARAATTATPPAQFDMSSVAAISGGLTAAVVLILAGCCAYLYRAKRSPLSYRKSLPPIPAYPVDDGRYFRNDPGSSSAYREYNPKASLTSGHYDDLELQPQSAPNAGNYIDFGSMDAAPTEAATTAEATAPLVVEATAPLVVEAKHVSFKLDVGDKNNDTV